MVPVVHPVGRQVDVERMLHARVQVELQLLAASLHHAKLRVALRHVGGALVHAAQFTRLHVEADGELLARELDVVAAIHLDPLVVSAEVEHSLLDLGIAHEVDGRVVG